MDHRDLAEHLLKRARAGGADAADVLVAEGTEFSVTVRKGEIETLEEAGSKALGIRVFVGQRSATIRYGTTISTDLLAGGAITTTLTTRIGNVADCEMEPFRGPNGEVTTLRDSIFSTIPGAPAYVARAIKFKMKNPALGQNIDLKDHNAIQGKFIFQS